MAEVSNTLVLVGTGVNLDHANLERWCSEWAGPLGARVSLRFVVDEADFAGHLAALQDDRVDGLVLLPGGPAAAAWIDLLAAAPFVDAVWVDLDEAERPRPAYFDSTGLAIRGRGVDGVRWALRLLLQRLAWPYETIAYGSARDQVGDLRLPAASAERVPVAVLLHGGFWRERWERDTIEPLAIDLAARGYATWNLEYRRVGPFGGGWPATGDDVAAGIDHLAELAQQHPLDLSRVVLVGHSAGGQLALWAARRRGSDTDARVHPKLLVALAGVADLETCSRRGLGDTGNGAAALMGGSPEELPQVYADASPLSALPLGVPQLVVQGRLDNIPDLVDMSRTYAAAAGAAGDEVEFLELDQANHFDIIDPRSPAWPPIADAIDRLLPA